MRPVSRSPVLIDPFKYLEDLHFPDPLAVKISTELDPLVGSMGGNDDGPITLCNTFLGKAGFCRPCGIPPHRHHHWIQWLAERAGDSNSNQRISRTDRRRSGYHDKSAELGIMTTRIRGIDPNNGALFEICRFSQSEFYGFEGLPSS